MSRNEMGDEGEGGTKMTKGNTNGGSGISQSGVWGGVRSAQ